MLLRKCSERREQRQYLVAGLFPGREHRRHDDHADVVKTEQQYALHHGAFHPREREQLQDEDVAQDEDHADQHPTSGLSKLPLGQREGGVETEGGHAEEHVAKNGRDQEPRPWRTVLGKITFVAILAKAVPTPEIKGWRDGE